MLLPIAHAAWIARAERRAFRGGQADRLNAEDIRGDPAPDFAPAAAAREPDFAGRQAEFPKTREPVSDVSPYSMRFSPVSPRLM